MATKSKSKRRLVDREKLDALLLVGRQLANCCYNVGQMASGTLTVREEEQMFETSKKWDAAVNELLKGTA